MPHLSGSIASPNLFTLAGLADPLAFDVRDLSAGRDRRTEPRHVVHSAYTLFRGRCGERRITGGVADVSAGGLSLLMSDPPRPGATLSLAIMLPGLRHIVVGLRGQVVAVHASGQAPERVGVRVLGFNSAASEAAMAEHLAGARPLAA